MAANASARRAGAGAVALALMLLPVSGPAGRAAGGTGPALSPAGTATGAAQPYRIGFASADVPALASVDPDTGAALRPPVASVPADEADTRGGALVFVTHRPGRVDTDLAYLAPGAATPVALTRDRFTDRHPALSPDGTRVAFESDRAGQFDIWIIAVDGTGPRRVTDHPADDTWPTWSPAGDRIAFGSNRDDPAGDIYSVAATGGATLRLTADPAADTEPAWSGTGAIAFTTTRFRGAPDIALLAPPGTAPRRLLPGEQPAWSPAGNRLAFVTRAADPSGDIATTTVSGGAAGPQRGAAGTPNQAQTHPTWAGDTLVYTAVGPAGGRFESDVWSADARGQERRDHTNLRGTAESAPAFTGDGRRLAYTESTGSSSRIVVADAEGGNPRPLTAFTAGRFDDDPAWSPDGGLIAFSRQFSEGSGAVLVARVADGAILGTVPEPAGLAVSDRQPAWSPDGTRLAFSRSASLLPVPPITPGPVDRIANPGGGFTVDQAVRTPSIPPTPDIVLLVDTTSSMDSAIADVRRNLHRVVQDVLAAQPTARFAVASFRDTGDGAELFRVRQNLTATEASVQAAVDGLASGGGGDTPEAWVNGLFQVASGAIAFRPGSSRIVALIGDAPSHDPSNGHPLGQAIAALQGTRARVVAVAVDSGGGEGGGSGLDGSGQATRVVDATAGQLVTANTPDAVSSAILSGLHTLDVTVTPSVHACDAGLSVTFTPDRPTTVTGGQVVHYGQTVTVAAGAAPGSTLRCTVAYQLSPNPGGSDFVVGIVVRIGDPRLPVVTVDDVTVTAPGPDGAVVTFAATAVDRSGRPLAPVCAPPAGSRFPVGQTIVTCTATDAAGRVGRDTARISVLDARAGSSPRIWVATLPGQLAVTQLTLASQVDLSEHVGPACPARRRDEAPAWSPDGGAVAFTAVGVLCLVDPAGGHARALVVPAGGEEVRDPAWSPDGALLGYAWAVPQSDESTRQSIRTVPATGGAPTTVVDTPGDAFQPAFWPLRAGLSLTVAAAPQPTYVGGAGVRVTVTARNTAGVPAGRAWLAADAPGVAPQATLLGTLAPGAGVTVTLTVPSTAALDAAAHGALHAVFPGGLPLTVVAQAAVRVIQPVLRVDPGIGPPGFVAVVTGAHFPPGVTVGLAWRPGISAPTRVAVRADGTFQTQLLVFHHDQLGPRAAVAGGAGFGPVTAAFLVVPPGQQPRDFVQRR
ncbi:MAG: hypothetical protein V7603_5716 [Micromonosporaceae bacterium]